MSLVDVRASSDTSGPGPGAGPGTRPGARPGAVLGCAGRGPLTPLSSPLGSPLDSPLGSPLGAVSLDAAVFVAKGGLSAAMLDDSDPRADSFADACGKPSDDASSLYPSPHNSPRAPNTPPPFAEDAENNFHQAGGGADCLKGTSSKRTRASIRETRSAGVVREAPPETRSARKGSDRETRSGAAKDPAPEADTRPTRVTRSTRRNSTPAADTAEAAPPSATPTSASTTPSTTATPAAPAATPAEPTTTTAVTPPSPPDPDTAASAEGCAGEAETGSPAADGELPAPSAEQHAETPAAPPVDSAAPDPVETTLSSTTVASTESTTAAPPPAVIPISAAPAAATTPAECARQEASSSAPTDCTPSPGGGAICGAAGTLPSLGATPSAAAVPSAAPAAAPAVGPAAGSASAFPSTRLPAGDGANAISADATQPEKSVQPMEQKPQPLPAATGVLASIIAAPTVATTAASSGPSPAHRFLPSMAAPSKRTTRLVSTEVTDALGRKTCLLPSLPRKASTTPILAAAGAGCLPGGILSRALTGGLPVKLSPTPLAKASDCVKAIDPAAKPGTRGPPGPPVVSMGILARTLSAPADLLTTSAPSEAAFRLAPVSGSPIVLSSGGAAVPTASLPLLSAATSTATPSFATFATRVTTATLTTTQLPPALASFTTALMTAQTTTASSVPALSKTILLNPILSKALAPAGQPPLGAPRTLTSSHPTISLVWPPELARAEARAPALAERSASLPETSSAALSEALTPDNKQSAAELPTAEPTAPDATPAQSPAVRAEATQPTSPACQGEPTDSGDDDSVSPRSITTTSTSNTFASTPSFAKLASLRDEEDDTANKTGLSDSCASSSSLSTATSPGLSCAPCAPGVPPGLGLDGIAAPEPASTAPLFTDGPDDLLDVADALNVLSSVDDDAVGSSQDSTQLSGGSSSSISSCCSGTSSCSGASNFSSSSTGSCCGRQRPRAVSPSRLGPQQCQVCSKVFSNASALAKHKLTHSDERRYVCSVCNKAFKRQDHLNGHMLTHRNKKPYECVLEGCNKSYCDARSLRRHEENHHHVKPPSGCKERENEKPKDKDVKKKCPKSSLILIAPTGESMITEGKSQDGLSESNDTQDSTSLLSHALAPTSSTLPTLSDSCVTFTLPLSADSVPDSPKAPKKPLPLPNAAGPTISTSTATKTGGPIVIPSVLSTSTVQSPAQGGLVLAPATTSVALNTPVSVQTVTTQPQLSPIRIPQVATPSPLSIPSLRPQLLTRTAPPKTSGTPQTALQATQSTDPFGQLLDQPIPETQTLTPPRQNSQNILHSNYSTSMLPSSQQLPIVQLSISQSSASLMSSSNAMQPQLTLSPNQQLVVQSASNKLQTSQGQQSQTSLSLAQPVKAEIQMSKTLQPTWTHMVVTSTSNHLANSLKAPALQISGAALVSPGRTAPLQRQAAVDSSGETYQPQVNGSPHAQSLVVQQNISGTLSAVQIKPTAAGEQHFLTSKRVKDELQKNVLPELIQAKECVPESVPKPPSRLINFQQKKAQSKSGLINEISAASTSSCTPVSTPTSTTTTTATIASTFALTLNASKTTSAPVLITSSGSIKTSTYTSSSGISSCKVSSTAHLGSVRDTQAAAVSQQSKPALTGVQEDAKKADPKAAAASAAANCAQSKPVACTLCNRRFKNIPALNGHMRLHGGFFKKESEAKRADKRESTGPPLQTASVSVRQLIEEKIIQKRGGAIGRAALLAGRDCSVSSSSSLTNSITTTTSAISSTNTVSTSLVNREAVERRRNSEHLENSFRKVPMTSDSATTVLQHHNYANNSFPTPPPSANVSNANSPPPPSPLTCTSFLPLSPQSDGSEPHQLLIHSEDPLLSSTIKDITRKKIDLGSLTVLGSVLVERGGELHLIQAPSAIVHKLSSRNTKQKQSVLDSPALFSPVSQSITTSTSGPTYHPSSSFFKADEMEDEVFLSPSIVPDSPMSLNSPVGGFSTSSRSPLGQTSSIYGQPMSVSQSPGLTAPPAKRPRLAKPYPAYKSRLRSCRREAICSASMPYTPAPMLDPNRIGSGLIAHTGSPWHCSSTTTDGEDSCDAMAISAPESDSFPHVNVGTRFQCPIPPCERKPYDQHSQEFLLWEPKIASKCTEAEVNSYLEFACCDAIPWGGRNQEYALHVLHMCDGDIQDAMVQLMQRNPTLPPDHLLLSYNYGITDLWNVDEMDLFVKSLTKNSKNWPLVSKEVVTKNANECVQFYYLWKKLCPDEYNNVKSAWKKQEKVGDDMNNNSNVHHDVHSKELSNTPNEKDSSGTQQGPLLNADTAHELAALFPTSSDVEEILNLNRPTETLCDVSFKAADNEQYLNNASPPEEIFKCRSDLTAQDMPDGSKTLRVLKDETFFSIQGMVKSDALQQSLPETGVEMSSNCHAFTDISQTFDESLTCLKNGDDLLLNDVKREPWEFCIKEEVKQELDGSNFDLTEAKNFITEFDSIKLNHVSESVADLNETVEDAPIIVTKTDPLHNDPHDQVKMEIESMMALHGIRVEDEPSSEVVSDLNTADQSVKMESLDQATAKSGSYSGPTEEHVSTSSDSRLFVCELTDCSASFNSRAALNGHIRIHGYRKSPPPNVSAGQRQQQRQEYPCETCGKIFAKLKSRNAHMKTHKLISADLAETLAGRASGISSSVEVPSTSSSTSTCLSFSTCMSFGLPVDESASLDKDVGTKENTAAQCSTADTDLDKSGASHSESTAALETENAGISEPESENRMVENSSPSVDAGSFVSLEVCFNSKSPGSPTGKELCDGKRTGEDVTAMASSYLNVSQTLSSTTTTFTGRVAVTAALDITQDKCLLGSKSIKFIEAQGQDIKKNLSKKLKTKSKSVSSFGPLSRSR